MIGSVVAAGVLLVAGLLLLVPSKSPAPSDDTAIPNDTATGSAKSPVTSPGPVDGAERDEPRRPSDPGLTGGFGGDADAELTTQSEPALVDAEPLASEPFSRSGAPETSPPEPLVVDWALPTDGALIIRVAGPLLEDLGVLAGERGWRRHPERQAAENAERRQRLQSTQTMTGWTANQFVGLRVVCGAVVAAATWVLVGLFYSAFAGFLLCPWTGLLGFYLPEWCLRIATDPLSLSD